MANEFKAKNGLITPTIALTTNQTANTVWAAPNGSAGVPTFRALVAADIPSLDWAKITSGKPTTLSGYGITDAAPSSHVGATGAAHGNATTSVAGFMSSTDKSKLDGIAAGATANNGTVTSVGGTGTVSGLTLSGTVTTTGNLTLGGTLAVSIDNISDEYRVFNNMGSNHATRTSFDAQGAAATVNFGCNFVQGSTNGPGVNSAGQYYSLFLGLGNDYAYNTYGAQVAIPRNVTNPYIAIRYEEGGVFAAWQKISAGYADSAGAVAWSGVTSKPTTLSGYGITDAASSTHTHSYLPLAGGTMTGAITFAGAQTWPTFNQNTTGSAGSVAWSGVTSKPTTLAGYGITDAASSTHTHSYLPLAGGTLTGQLISTATYNAANGGGNIYLNSATGNRIDFNANGIAAPAFTTRSAGTKIVLYPSLSPSAADMAIGIEADAVWFSTYTTAAKFKWYAGTTLGLQLLNGVLSATTGFQINGAATSGQYLRGNGTNFVSSAIQAADVPTLNQNTTGSAGSVAWSGVTSKPTTLSGYGITDAASSTHTHSYLPLAGGNLSGLLISDHGTIQIGSNTGTYRQFRYDGSISADKVNFYTILHTGSTSASVQFGSFGVGTAASGTTGEIRATNNITAYYSDRRLKNIFGEIPDALGKVERMSGIYFQNNEVAESFGYTDKSQQVGVIAQQVQQEVPEAVKRAPFDSAFTEDGGEYSISGEEYLTVQYEKLVPVLLQAIKELSAKVKLLEKKCNA